MGNITEQVTDESPQLSRNLKSISGLALVTVLFVARANGIHVQSNSAKVSRSPRPRHRSSTLRSQPASGSSLP
jgi:hypothetical protein